jgi:hypothetical protein
MCTALASHMHLLESVFICQSLSEPVGLIESYFENDSNELPMTLRSEYLCGVLTSLFIAACRV